MDRDPMGCNFHIQPATASQSGFNLEFDHVDGSGQARRHLASKLLTDFAPEALNIGQSVSFVLEEAIRSTTS